jgi:hypothetical protein
MPGDELKIIIKKSGEIWIDLGGLEAKKVRNYKDMFEEILGPIKGELMAEDGGTASGGVYISDFFKDEEEDKEKIRDEAF